MGNTLDKEKKKTLIIWSILIIGIAAIYLLYAGLSLADDRKKADERWNHYLNQELNEDDKEAIAQAEASTDIVSVDASTYVISIDEVDLKQSSFITTFQVLFSWDKEQFPAFDMMDNFRIVNGKIVSQELMEEYDKEDRHYQMYLVTADVEHLYETKRFPLSSYQLRFYLRPKDDMSRVYMQVADDRTSGANNQLNVSGFEMLRCDVANFFFELENKDWYNNGEEEVVYSEVLTAIELNRSTWGLYFKCTISLIGISIWLFLCMFVCIHHKMDGIGLLPPVVFGMVSNVLVGANLVPDALETGLLEYINIWGIYTIVMGTIIIISINQIRRVQQDEHFAKLFGRIAFAEFVVTIIAGYIIIPVCAYRW